MQNKYKLIASTLLLSSLFSASAIAADTLTNKAGMTLYTFDKDSKGTSNCNGGCATQWPPHTASEQAKIKDGYTIITRNDGSKQWSYNDKPLYTRITDTKKGDTTGDGAGGVWHTATKEKAWYSY